MEQKRNDFCESGVIDFIKKKEAIEHKKKIGCIDEDENRTSQDLLNLWDNFRNEFDKQIIEGNISIKDEKVDKISDKECCKDIDPLYEEMEILKMKLNYPIPNVILAYIIGASMAIMFFLMCLLLWLYKGIIIVHPFISFISLIGTIGLLFTSILTLKNFKKFIIKVKGE